MRVVVGILMAFACACSAIGQETDSIPTFSNTDAPEESTTPLQVKPDASDTQVQPEPESPARDDDWVEQTTGIVPQSEAGMNAVKAVNALMDGEDLAATGATPGNLPDSSESLISAFLSMVRGLAIVLALMLVIYYLVRRFGRQVPALAGSQLGKVMGTLHLSKDASLHFVKAGGRVLVIGVNPNAISHVAEFDAIAFDDVDATADAPEAFNPDSFLAQLQTQSTQMAAAKRDDDDDLDDVEDDDIAALRGDIHRLQQYLREETRGSGDADI